MGLVVVEGIDTIDVSLLSTDLLGHSYFGDNDSVIADLRQLLLHRGAWEARRWLKRAIHNGLEYWRFIPPRS